MTRTGPDTGRVAAGGAQRNGRVGLDADTTRALIVTARGAPSAGTRARALETVVAAQLPLAHTLAHRYGHRGIEQEDLEQVAALALLKAIERYDIGASTPFGAYATPTITGELRRHFRDRGWLVRPSRSIQELRQRMVRTREDLTRALGREPDQQELATALQVSAETIREIEVANQNLRPTSLDTPVSPAGPTLLELVQQHPGADLDDLDEQLDVRDAVASLPKEQQQLIHLRYTQDLNQKEVAELLDLAPMTVSRLQRRALQTLAKRLSAHRHLA